MEPYLTSGTNIYSESTNTERLNAVRDLLPAEAPDVRRVCKMQFKTDPFSF